MPELNVSNQKIAYIKIDDEDYYVTNLEVDGFYKRVEVTVIKNK